MVLLRIRFKVIELYQAQKLMCFVPLLIVFALLLTNLLIHNLKNAVDTSATTNALTDMKVVDEGSGIVNDDKVEEALGIGAAIKTVISKNALWQLQKSKTLRGTQALDTLELDAFNNLVVSKNIIDLFDYFLLATGEVDDAVIEEGTIAYLNQRLPEPALTTALQLFESYMDYIVELEKTIEQSQAGPIFDSTAFWNQSLDLQENTIIQLENAFVKRSELRQLHFDREQYGAIWQQDEQYDQYTLLQLKLSINSSLTKQEKQERLESYYGNLAEPVRRELNTVSSITLSSRGELDSGNKGSGLGTNELSGTTKIYGKEVSHRLEELHRQRTLWNTRYRQYRADRAATLVDGLDPNNHKQLQQELLAKHFVPTEWRRVKALDSIESSQ